MTLAQKMLDERRLGFAEGREEGWEEGREEGREEGIEEGLRKAIVALKGVLDPNVIAERFQMSPDKVADILNQ